MSYSLTGSSPIAPPVYPLMTLAQPLSQGLFIAFVVGFVLVMGITTILRDWRWTIPALLGQYVLVGGFIGQFKEPNFNLGGWNVPIIALILILVGFTVTLILILTMLTLGVEPEQASLDEFQQAALRRMARQAEARRASLQPTLVEYTFPTGALIIAAIVSLTLDHLSLDLSTSVPGNVNLILYWLIFSGLFTLVLAHDILKIALGLFTGLNALTLWYVMHDETRINAMSALAVLSILLALAVAYLSSVLYTRLKTLNLDELMRK